jgi:hypothetical protein
MQPDHKAASRWYALALFIAALAVAATGPMVLPRLLIWILAGVLIWGAGTILYRTVDWKRGDRPPAPPPLRPGESYDTAVKLTFAPNVPIAEAICSRLRANGIEAFYKRLPVAQAFGAGTNDLAPVEVWVAEHDLARARALLGPA